MVDGDGLLLNLYAPQRVDVFGMGHEPWPEIPNFGLWQIAGVLIGQITIAIGFILLIPPRTFRHDH